MLGSGDKVRDKVSFIAEESSFTDLDRGGWDVLMRALCWSWMQKRDSEVQSEGACAADWLCIYGAGNLGSSPPCSPSCLSGVLA